MILLVLSCGPFAVRHAGAGVTVSDVVNLGEVCDARTSEQGAHGGTQSRVCRTSHGTYATYLGNDANDKAVLHVVRIRDGHPTRLLTTPTSVAGSNGVHVVCDADEQVYVIAAGSKFIDGAERALLTAYHVDRNTGATTKYSETVAFGKGSSYGYSSVSIDPARRDVHVLYSGGDAPGYFAWVRFDMAGKRWATKAVVAELAYRHCYNYGFADGRGGMVILSERDIRNATAGIIPSDKGRKIDADYVWDELRLFYIGDVAKPDYKTVDVEPAVYDKEAGLYPIVQNNWKGDTYLDAQGRLHVLYFSDDNNRKRGSFNRHAIFDAGGKCIRNALLPFQEDSAMRMAQSTDGRHYIIAIPYSQPARVQVWGATDAEGAGYALEVEKRLSKRIKPSYAGLAVSCPRNGSRQDDQIDCLFPADKDYHHFTIRLKSE
ncbi:hypothetical protein V5E97_00795 [Singulisphaera sp. Ch08]|uniref:Uncharacterized protein n=1 Tax=Singulisphaera sp. Ch08 TaxID=3120278 RepID=A0AAU7CGU5_9BACT